MKTKQITLVSGEKIILSGNEVFVTMTDKFLSGWGLAQNRIAKRVIICENTQQAYSLKSRLYSPKHLMKYVNITFDRPYYAPSKYVVSWDKYTDNLFNY